MGNSLCGIVNHDCKLVAPHPVDTAQRKITRKFLHTLRPEFKVAILPRDSSSLSCEQPRRSNITERTLTAGSRIRNYFVPRKCSPTSFSMTRNVLPGAVAVISLLVFKKTLQNELMVRATLRLPHDGSVGVKTECLELHQDCAAVIRFAACGIGIFDTNQPPATIRTNIEPAVQYCNQRSRVQSSSRGRGEPPAICQR